MTPQEILLDQLKQLNVIIMATNKQLEAHRLLHDSAALIENNFVCDKERELMHVTMDLSLDQTAQQQRLIRLINKCTGEAK
jgi:hypothetical protein